MSGRKFSLPSSDALDYEYVWYMTCISVSFLAVFYIIDSLGNLFEVRPVSVRNYGSKINWCIDALNIAIFDSLVKYIYIYVYYIRVIKPSGFKEHGHYMSYYNFY